MNKTNVMRFLDINHIPHQEYEYDSSLTDGEKIANILKENPEQVFKTLVTIGSDKNYYVFCVPVNCTLSLKKAAKIANVKSIEMIKQKDLLSITGYIHGGCSPLLMKKTFQTYIDESAILFESIFISGGRVGYQVSLNIDDLKKVLNFDLADLTQN